MGNGKPSSYSAGFSINPFGGGGGNRYGGGMSMSYPGAGGGGGGGGLQGLLSILGGGIMGTNPMGAGIMALGSMIPGIMGAFAAGNRQKKKEKWTANEQRAYKQAVDKYFPEMSQESFQYQNPGINNAITGALAYRMGNMFGNWGMPQDMRQNAGSLNELFGAMMPRYGAGGIVTRPQVALIGEQGPEAIVPLGQRPGVDRVSRPAPKRSPEQRPKVGPLPQPQTIGMGVAQKPQAQRLPMGEWMAPQFTGFVPQSQFAPTGPTVMGGMSTDKRLQDQAIHDMMPNTSIGQMPGFNPYGGSATTGMGYPMMQQRPPALNDLQRRISLGMGY